MVRPIDWAEIFRRRPDLEPPGYRATIKETASARESAARDAKVAKLKDKVSKGGPE